MRRCLVRTEEVVGLNHTQTKTIKMMAKEGVKLAFRYGDWQPTQAQWLYAGRCVQQEEQARISKFVFRKDAKAAMTGRLLIRKVLSELLGAPHRDLVLARSNKGKPYVLHPRLAHTPDFSFNMSHQGDYTVVVAEMRHLVGVDTMKVELPSGRSVDAFFKTMRRQLTDQEWSVIESGLTEWQRLNRFYRYWCLKESFVKALGVGIGYSLRRLSFHLGHPDLPRDAIATDTTVDVDGVPAPQWYFEEQRFDGDHLMAVAVREPGHDDHDGDHALVLDYMPTISTGYNQDPPPPRPCEFISWEELIKDSQPFTPVHSQFWTRFLAKKEVPQSKTAILQEG